MNTLQRRTSTKRNWRSSNNVKSMHSTSLRGATDLFIVKEKYGSDAELDDETDSEEDESEDEDGEELTPAMDVAMLRTLAMIRSKNPAIYDSTKNVFEGALAFVLRGTKFSSKHEPRRTTSNIQPASQAKSERQGAFLL
jgi:hypothetical protein